MDSLLFFPTLKDPLLFEIDESRDEDSSTRDDSVR
jgi:hypothetical protein